MSVERDPRVGDVFRQFADGELYEVVAVTEHNVFYESTGLRVPCFNSVGAWRADAILIPPRPKVRDQWGYYASHCGFVFGLCDGEFDARRVTADSSLLLVRIVNGRVCDEYGVPFEVGS